MRAENRLVKRVLITGLSGVGKSSVGEELRARGYKAVDTDEGNWKHLVDLPAGSPPTGVEGSCDLLWREDLMDELLATEDADVLFVIGTVPNQGRFYDRFDSIVLLTASEAAMAERLKTRTNNPYGKRPEELERALALKTSIEPLLRPAATIELDTSDLPLEQVADELIARMMSGRT